ncbi:hypothetical protein JYU34_018928 [Plutella xylostella]|uniref:Uncharacterized protein n=1 Tax=Plutella xylostella TaxID=51655 RepID=A0ABQ7PZ38_PLUXY|nr:hypothetical protein JYU34_018928 [Plutella xylostella]
MYIQGVLQAGTPYSSIYRVLYKQASRQFPLAPGTSTARSLGTSTARSRTPCPFRGPRGLNCQRSVGEMG